MFRVERLFKQKIQFLQQINVKKCPNVHPAYGAAIRTHYLTNMSLHPLPLDQGSLERVRLIQGSNLFSSPTNT